jgi:hypothetical protein
VTFWYGAFSTGTLSYTAEVTDVVVSGSMVRFMHRVPAGNEPASNVYVVTEVTDNGPGSADEIAWAFHWDENVARPWFTNGLDPQVPSHTIVSGNAVVTD